MGNKNYIKCDLYGLRDGDVIEGNLKYPVIHSKNTFLRTIIVSYDLFGNYREFFTGVNFDCSLYKEEERYSKFYGGSYVKKKSILSSNPIHIHMNSRKSYLSKNVEKNFEYVGTKEIAEYYSEIIQEFDTLENYEKYLLSLKEMAYNRLNDARKERDRVKRIKLTRIV